MSATLASHRRPARPSYRNKFVAALVTLVITAVASAVLFGNDGPADPDIESLGLAIDTQIEAGSTFEVTVPMDPATSIVVAAAPPGVEAEIMRTPSGEAIVLSIAVDPGTPQGSYDLALMVNREATEYRLAWPFEVVEPGS